jgi:hypothetical protein
MTVATIWIDLMRFVNDRNVGCMVVRILIQERGSDPKVSHENCSVFVKQ